MSDERAVERATAVEGGDTQQPEAAPAPGSGETVDVKLGMFGVSGSGDTSGYGGLVRRVQSRPPSQRPYGGYFDDVADDLERAFPSYGEAIERVVVDRGEITFYVRRAFQDSTPLSCR